MAALLPLGQPYAQQNSPATVLLYLAISRGVAYPSADMTTVTSMTAVVTFPDQTTATWTFSPEPGLSTASRGVFSRPFAAGDTAQLGNTLLVATPFIGIDPLPPAAFTLAVRLPALG